MSGRTAEPRAEAAEAETAPVLLGTLDDTLEEAGFASGGVEGLALRLAQAAVAGGPVLVVEGFLLNSEAGRQVLCDTADRLSPFHALARQGFLTVLRRGPSLAEVPERAAPSVPKFARLVAAPDWPEARRRIARAEKLLEGAEALAPWPRRDVGDAFRRLVADLAARPEAQAAALRRLPPGRLQRLIEAFAAAPPGLAARSAFQAAAEAVLGPGPEAAAERQEAMRLAAETYHLALAGCLACEGRPLRVETRFSPAYSPLLAPPVQVAGSGRWRVPMLRLPAGRLRREGGRWWARLDAVVAPDGPIAPLKRRYLLAREAFLAAPSDAAAKALAEAAGDYAAALAALFGAGRKDFTDTLAYEAGSGMALDAAAGGAGQAAIALGLVGGGLLSLGAAPLFAVGGAVAGVLVSRALRGVLRQRFVLRPQEYLSPEAVDAELFRRLGEDAFAALPLRPEAVERLFAPLPERH
ncbi:MAG: hypothetical protein RMK90_10535 [Acetobacteraceae bacterium]|nr:hypothetical protein [Acetobacteraceae bacterium]